MPTQNRERRLSYRLTVETTALVERRRLAAQRLMGIAVTSQSTIEALILAGLAATPLPAPTDE